MSAVFQSPQAELDLLDIWCHVAQDNYDAADLLLDAISADALDSVTDDLLQRFVSDPGRHLLEQSLDFIFMSPIAYRKSHYSTPVLLHADYCAPLSSLSRTQRRKLLTRLVSPIV